LIGQGLAHAGSGHSRSFRSGLWACAWAAVLGAPLLVAAWLAEALHWYQQGRGMLLDGEGGIGVGGNLGDAVWWTLPFLLVWALPLGVRVLSRRIDPTKPQQRPLPALIDRRCPTHRQSHDATVRPCGPATQDGHRGTGLTRTTGSARAVTSTPWYRGAGCSKLAG
jgi:hypothetical protein